MGMSGRIIQTVLIMGVVAVIAIVTHFGNAGPNVMQQAVFPTPTPEAARKSFGDDIHLVGKHIEPGLYYAGHTEFDSCYWERLSGLSGGVDDVIVNGIEAGPLYIQIQAEDMAFKSQGCGDWVWQSPDREYYHTHD